MIKQLEHKKNSENALAAKLEASDNKKGGKKHILAVVQGKCA